jgi:DNA-binding transcriptional LysR family regulator
MSQIAGLWCSPTTRERVPSIEHPRDLRTQQVAHLRGVTSITLFKPAFIIEVPIKGPEVDDLQALKALILARRVFGWLPVDLAEPDAQAGRLVRVLPEWERLDPVSLPESEETMPDSLHPFPL